MYIFMSDEKLRYLTQNTKLEGKKSQKYTRNYLLQLSDLVYHNMDNRKEKLTNSDGIQRLFQIIKTVLNYTQQNSTKPPQVKNDTKSPFSSPDNIDAFTFSEPYLLKQECFTLTSMHQYSGNRSDSSFTVLFLPQKFFYCESV